ncbi:MAG: hypothetical protein KTR15_00200 [Phycisphaeraceae bacterium]|nr:hypothetical protein [Phycisphaeraceae bacterium]
MPDQALNHTLPALVTAEDGTTVWSQRGWPIEARGGMLLSQRIDCSSLRLRASEPGYQADWHVAGDPTLIIVRAGRLRITLHDGGERDFGPGDAFIAADHVPDGQGFDHALHGHRAKAVGDNPIEAVHIKLAANEG